MPAGPTISSSTQGAWRYDVVADAGAKELAVDARIVAPAGESIGVESAGRFVRDVEIETPAGFVPLVAQRDAVGDVTFRLPACPAAGCHVRYRFELTDAARAIDDVGCAEEVTGGVILTSPSAWLLHPADPGRSQGFELHVTTQPGTTFVAGILPGAGTQIALPPASYVADITDLPNPAWSAFGPLRLSRIEAEGGVVDVAIAPGPLDAGDAAIDGWVRGAARALRSYYGRASIRRALVVVVPRGGAGLGFARTLGNGGATILANVGKATTPEDFASSWELIHEMLHVSFPTVPRESAWMEEGMATYVEPLIRARLGILPAEEVFARFRERMPFGLPDHRDGGLDGTRSWGRTYWGGALFCLLADVAIRERTQNQRSLDDALRAVLAAGGNVSQRWTMDQVIAEGDAATGVPVLRELYDRMAHAPVPVDLDALWRRLGVGDMTADKRVTFDDTAELAAVRRAMTTRKP